MSRRLFGTDGVRGPAGEVVTAELALAIARAATAGLVERGVATRPQVLVLRDTRASGPMLEHATAAGVAAAGGDALLAGVLPTPAAPLLIRDLGLHAAVVLSASHNPFEDNGIKLFGPDALKLGDDAEAAIEAQLDHDPPPRRDVGTVRALHAADEDYLRALDVRFSDLDLSGMDVALDCANGATHRVAPEALRRRGAKVTAVAVAPDGRNINDGVGSTHVEAFATTVREGGHDVGFAFDGDGDRVLAVDRTGAVVDGDELLALAARHLKAQDRLPGDGVAVTVMTNFGFHTAMQEAGVEVATTKVGDRYVLEALLERGWALGGEQSGHVIERGFVPSGDGLGAALLTLEALGGQDLADRHAMRKLPQRLVNVRVADKQAATGADDVLAAVAEAEGELAGRGRVLLRPSGTEALVRVMAEAPTDEEAEAVCARLVAVVERVAGPA